MNDSGARLLDYDPVAGTACYFVPNADGTFGIANVQITDPVLDRNAERYRQFDERATWKGDWHWVAAIPMLMWQEWMRSGLTEDDKAMRRVLNDGDFRKLRTRPGRI